jgi:hypothetical protein
MYAMLGVTGPMGSITRYAPVHEIIPLLKQYMPKYANRIRSIELPEISHDIWNEIVYKKSTYSESSDFKLSVLCTIARRLAHFPSKNICILYIDYSKRPDEAPHIFHQAQRSGYNTSYTGSWRSSIKPWCIYLWTRDELQRKLNEVNVYHIHET